MEEHELQQVKRFMFADIRREIDLAKVSQATLKKKLFQAMGIHPGGGNFLAALGLLAYTEFAGRVLNDDFSQKNAGENFRDYLRLMGDKYEEFDRDHDVYGKFRCNMVHQYYLSECDIKMTTPPDYKGIGIGQNQQNGRYFFIVETYLMDFEIAFDQMERDLFGL